jgi:hypothetical protein
VASGAVSYAGTNIFDRLSIPTMQISQLSPGVVYFIMLKGAAALLILLDVEDNSRRAARK